MSAVKDDQPVVVDRETDQKKSHEPSGPRIRCPLCAWSPARTTAGLVTAGISDTFDTGGICPSCPQHWTSTRCLKCGGWSRQLDWYEKSHGGCLGGCCILLQIVAEKADRRRALRCCLGGRRLEPTLQHRTHSTHSRDPPASEWARPTIVTDALGAHPVVVERPVCRCPDDQCTLGIGGHEASVSGCIEIPQVPDPRGRLLRVDAHWQNKAAV